MNEQKPPLLNGQRFSEVKLVDGSKVTTPLTFTSDGPGCMYPRFVSDWGRVVPWHAVIDATPLHPGRWSE